MEDSAIIGLYWNRDDNAILQTQEKYGAYCLKISQNILGNLSDGEENVNDTYLKLWNTIPPERPKHFSAYLGKIARNLAINKYKAKHTDKRLANESVYSVERKC